MLNLKGSNMELQITLAINACNQAVEEKGSILDCIPITDIVSAMEGSSNLLKIEAGIIATGVFFKDSIYPIRELTILAINQ